ncbi:MAG: chorismate mutase [Bacteroidales bacterium]|nr:chorismate mutase [Bacteroidales bacterium]
MNELEKLRQEIQQADKEMASLFRRRMEIVSKVLEYKVANGLPVLDAEQEARVIANNIDNVPEKVLQEYYVLFLKEVMNISKSYQHHLTDGMKVAYSGVPGAFGQIAASRIFPEANLVPYPDFEGAYKACEKGEVDITVLPIENSFSGEVGKVSDLIFEGSLYINMMLELNVTQNLIGIKGARTEEIKTVISHPQALSQCSSFIHRHGLSEIEYENTAMAAKFVAEKGDRTMAAIGSVETANLYGLEIIEANISHSRTNTTRFATLSRVMNAPSKSSTGEYFILMFTVKNEAGALAKVLNIIGAHGFNMNNLRSRPMKEPLWNHYFYAELEGNASSEDGKDLMRQLHTVCDKFKLVGAYKRI